MPLYDYRCEACDHEFEALVRGSAESVACPRCRATRSQRQLSVPAPAQTARGGLAMAAQASGCGRPQCGGGMCAGLE